jgi:hypothetical protein
VLEIAKVKSVEMMGVVVVVDPVLPGKIVTTINVLHVLQDVPGKSVEMMDVVEFVVNVEKMNIVNMVLV